MGTQIYMQAAFMHELDRRAFEILLEEKNFNKFYEAYDESVRDAAEKIHLLSSSIKLGPKQMPEVYNLLPPICHTLKIQIPDLYLVKPASEGEMNAWTTGDENPFICITEPLVKSLPLTMISSVLAHECGHIACHHVKYHTLARKVLSDGKPTLIEKIIGKDKKKAQDVAFRLLFWDRCSELSADRAAVLCDGTSDYMIDTLLRVNGYGDEIDRNAFIQQAIELKNLVAGSTAYQTLEKMLIMNEDHPRLATRAYECYEWTKSDTYRTLRNDIKINSGDRKVQITQAENQKKTSTARVSVPRQKNIIPWMIGKERSVATSTFSFNSDSEESEILAAEIELDASELINNDNECDSISSQLEKVNAQLENLTSDATKDDYAFAVISGIITGMIDAFFVAPMKIGEEDFSVSNKQVSDFVVRYADKKGLKGNTLGKTISNLENNYKVHQDNIWKGTQSHIAATNHHLADLAHHPTPTGLVAAIIVQFLRVGIFVNKEGDLHIIPVKTEERDVLEVYAPVVLAGILNWLAWNAEHYNNQEIPRGMQKLIHLAATTPVIIEIAKCADNWSGHLVSDMAGSHQTAGGGMGIPGVFVSLLYEISSLPGLSKSGLLKFIDDIYENRDTRFDLRKEITIYKFLGKQTVPVILNELLIRTGYFITRLLSEIREKSEFNLINWNNVIPFGNRTIDRMLAVSTITFETADTVDASIHAALESGGNWVIFAGQFASRVNYVGAARATVAVVKEVSWEAKEEQLIREKMLLTQQQTEEVTKLIEVYKDKLAAEVSAYLAEDLEAFMTGLDEIKEGVSKNNSDLVIHGNTTIQRRLGKNMQFTSQEEFDDFMGSDFLLEF